MAKAEMEVEVKVSTDEKINRRADRAAVILAGYMADGHLPKSDLIARAVDVEYELFTAVKRAHGVK